MEVKTLTVKFSAVLRNTELSEEQRLRKWPDVKKHSS